MCLQKCLVACQMQHPLLPTHITAPPRESTLHYSVLPKGAEYFLPLQVSSCHLKYLNTLNCTRRNAVYNDSIPVTLTTGEGVERRDWSTYHGVRHLLSQPLLRVCLLHETVSFAGKNPALFYSHLHSP